MPVPVAVIAASSVRLNKGLEVHIRLRLVSISSMCLLAFTAYAADQLETFLSRNPAAEATRAFNSGDKRHIVVPVCQPQGGEAIPGWPLSGPTPPGLWAALEKAQRPFHCEELGEGPESAIFLRALNFAEQYNKKLLELDKID